MLLVGRIVCVLLIGTFIANADSSLLTATYPIIALEFGALYDLSWLMTSFALAQVATLLLCGKLNDIYGRKLLLILAYTLFALGCGLVGFGTLMSTLILGRVISGAGSSGMTTLVSILITDLVPLRDVAPWRSCVNIVATTGRSIGGPVGGWLPDTVGWQWSFSGQVPLAGIAIALVAFTLPSSHNLSTAQGSQRIKLARIDFLGAVTLTLSILGLLVPLEIGGDRVPWCSPTIFLLLGASVLFTGLFLATERWFAKEPIVPLLLLRQRDVTVSALVMLFHIAGQTGLMYTIPVYFQITAGVSNTEAGAHLVPAVAGNAMGGVLAGFVIKRTGRYRTLTLGATIVSSAAYVLVILRWHGNTNWLESLYILPGGFGLGIAQSALFISVQAAIDPAYTAIAASTLYLTSSIGSLAGMAGISAVLQAALRRQLNQRLGNLGFSEQLRQEIIDHAASDVHYIDHATSAVATAVTKSYVDAFTWTHGTYQSSNMARHY